MQDIRCRGRRQTIPLTSYLYAVDASVRPTAKGYSNVPDFRRGMPQATGPYQRGLLPVSYSRRRVFPSAVRHDNSQRGVGHHAPLWVPSIWQGVPRDDASSRGIFNDKALGLCSRRVRVSLAAPTHDLQIWDQVVLRMGVRHDRKRRGSLSDLSTLYSSAYQASQRPTLFVW